MGGLSNLCGSPKTKLKGITGSGWGADTGHVVEAFLLSFKHFFPMQVSPFKLGRRFIPPFWSGTVGWKYTFEGCSSNFLDCYFLDHSPCPPIRLDVRNHPGKARINKKRFDFGEWGASSNPKWWEKVMGKPTTTIPAQTVQNLQGLPAEQAIYAYFFRPKFEVRRIIHHRVQMFNLTEECTILHVRRGDSITHRGLNLGAYGE